MARYFDWRMHTAHSWALILGQYVNVHRDPLIASSQRLPGGARERLPTGVPDDIAAGNLVGTPWRRESAWWFGHSAIAFRPASVICSVVMMARGLKYAGPRSAVASPARTKGGLPAEPGTAGARSGRRAIKYQLTTCA
jgi:hypothetical protein